MQLGLFDHLESVPARPLDQQYAERINFISEADDAGFWGFHVAEHHSSRLNMTPGASIWLSSVARETSKIRLGPLVYLLTLYTPLRLAEDIAMLDNLSNGRLEVGVGRGVSPFELNFHHIDPEKSREIFFDAFECLKKAMTQEELSHEGEYFHYSNVPITMLPKQKPYPAFWYGSSNTTGATWAGQQGMHFTANGATTLAHKNITAYREALETRGGIVAQPKAEFAGGGAVGLLRHIHVAETDEEAIAVAKPAIEYHIGSLNWLRDRNKDHEFAKRTNVHRGLTFESWVEAGLAIVGSPETVKKKLFEQQAALNLNYFLCYMFFGTMPADAALRSLDLFTREVKPALDKL